MFSWAEKQLLINLILIFILMFLMFFNIILFFSQRVLCQQATKKLWYDRCEVPRVCCTPSLGATG